MARPRGKYPPQTPAQRQEKCRAIKRGKPWYFPSIATDLPPELLPNGEPNQFLLGAAKMNSHALPAPPTPPVTAIQKTLSSDANSLAIPDADGPGDALHLSLPPAVAARLRLLLNRHEAGKSLSAAERGEAQGLLDIAEYFAVQRLRHRLVA
jgi:hypothetical protein